MSTDIQVLAYIQKEIAKLRDEQIAYIAASRADTYDEYKKICGVIRGLGLADSIINEIGRAHV